MRHFNTKIKQMNNQKDNFFVGRLKSLRYAVRGAAILLRTEHAIISQASIGLLFFIMGFAFDITRFEWILQILCIGLILAVESLNTAVEKLCDFIHPDFHERIGFIKDISAGAVTFAVVSSLTAAGFIYYPYISNLF